MAVDAPGVRKVIELARRPKRRILTSCPVFAGDTITPSRKYSKESTREKLAASMLCTALITVGSLEKIERRRMGRLGGSNAIGTPTFGSRGLHSRTSRSLHRHDAMGHGEVPTMPKAQVEDKFTRTWTNTVTFMITLP